MYWWEIRTILSHCLPEYPASRFFCFATRLGGPAISAHTLERGTSNHNFQVYGHQKFKVGGIRSFGNVLAYVSGYGEKWTVPGNMPATPNAMVRVASGCFLVFCSFCQIWSATVVQFCA